MSTVSQNFGADCKKMFMKMSSSRNLHSAAAAAGPSHGSFKELARAAFYEAQQALDDPVVTRPPRKRPQPFNTTPPISPVPPEDRFRVVSFVVDEMQKGNVKEALRLMSLHNISDTELSNATLDEVRYIRVKKLYPDLTEPVRRPVPPPQNFKHEVVNTTFLPILDELPAYVYLAAHAATYGMDHTSIGYTKQDFNRALKLAAKIADAKEGQNLLTDIQDSWRDFKELLAGLRNFQNLVNKTVNTVEKTIPTIITIATYVVRIATFAVDVVTAWKLYKYDPQFAAVFIATRIASWSLYALASYPWHLKNATALIDWVSQLIQPTPTPAADPAELLAQNTLTQFPPEVPIPTDYHPVPPARPSTEFVHTHAFRNAFRTRYGVEYARFRPKQVTETQIQYESARHRDVRHQIMFGKIPSSPNIKSDIPSGSEDILEIPNMYDSDDEELIPMSSSTDPDLPTPIGQNPNDPDRKSVV